MVRYNNYVSEKYSKKIDFSLGKRIVQKCFFAHKLYYITKGRHCTFTLQVHEVGRENVVLYQKVNGSCCVRHRQLIQESEQFSSVAQTDNQSGSPRFKSEVHRLIRGVDNLHFNGKFSSAVVDTKSLEYLFTERKKKTFFNT